MGVSTRAKSLGSEVASARTSQVRRQKPIGSATPTTTSALRPACCPVSKRVFCCQLLSRARVRMRNGRPCLISRQAMQPLSISEK